ncbi:MAG TPA: M20/M25/M40 family metallo-hydrolase [Gemmatimonadales bacterium]|jgi:hypothetical protein
MRQSFVAVVFVCGVACSPPSSGAPRPIAAVDVADVERIVAVLASDQMAGRAALMAGAARAAAFIRAEFAGIGLDTFAGASDYLQAVPLHSVRVVDAQVRMDGEAIAGGNTLLRVTVADVDWDDTTDVDVSYVGPADDVRAAVSGALNGTRNRLVVVHPEHRQVFGTYRRFVTGRVVAGEPVTGPTVVLVLRDTPPTAFSIHVRTEVRIHEAMNVVGVLPGRRADEIVLFSAHYDHIGIRPAVQGDSIGNGANDNASGTTGVIALARYFKALGPQERTLVFVAFTAEEIGGFGSRYFASRVNPDHIVAMFNLEMIGKPGNEGPNSAWITGFDRSSFGTILQEAVAGTPYRFYPDPYPSQRLFYRSDNATLARLGVPAHSISTTPIDVDPDYHQVTDEVETLDIPHLTATIRAIAAGARTIVSGEATPTRVDTTQLAPRR